MNHAQLLFPDFALILCGFLLCRYTALDRPIWDAVDKLVYFFLFPVLLFHSTVRSPLDLGAASSLMLAGVATAGCGVALTYALPHLPWIRRQFTQREYAASAQAGFRFNGFILLALADRLAGPQGPLLAAIIIGSCVPVLNVAAIWPMARASGEGLWSSLARNPLLIATLAGLLSNLAGLRIPEWAEPTVARIGGASLALGLMCAGAGLRIAALNQARTLTVCLLLIRHLVMPLCAWVLARLLGLSPAQTAVLLAFSAVPTAASCYVLAARMGYDGAHVAAVVTLSTLLGAASLSFALGVLR